MPWKPNLRASVAMIAFASGLVACDGEMPERDAGPVGGSDATVTEDAGAPSEPLVGRFDHGAVEGLRYATESQQGETGEGGEFSYLEGETVAFFVGDVALGEAPGAAVITPFDLAGIAPPTTLAEQQRAVARAHGFEAEPFEVAINLAAFLQTIDEDGDPTNGIQIVPSMHTVAEGHAVDFERSYEEFFRDLGLRRLMADARAASVFPNGRPVRRAAVAANALYAALGLTPTVAGYARAVAEEDDDPATLERETLRTYDDEGHRIGQSFRSDPDPTTERLTHVFEYNAYGALTLRRIDGNGDPTDGFLQSTYTYDDDGHLISIVVDDDDDPSNGDQAYLFTLDEVGTRVQEDRLTRGASPTHHRLTYTYDARGRVTERVRDEEPETAGGVSVHTFTYLDDNGSYVEEVDLGDDGSVDQRDRYEYDDEGQPTLRVREDGEGNVTLRETWEWDGLTFVDRLDADGDPTNGIDLRVVVTFDENRQVVFEERDDDDDPSNGITYRRVATYDTEGRRLTEIRDQDRDDANGFQFRYVDRYEEGLLVETIRDDDDDASNGVSTVTTYEPARYGFGLAFSFVPS